MPLFLHDDRCPPLPTAAHRPHPPHLVFPPLRRVYPRLSPYMLCPRVNLDSRSALHRPGSACKSITEPFPEPVPSSSPLASSAFTSTSNDVSTTLTSFSLPLPSSLSTLASTITTHTPSVSLAASSATPSIANQSRVVCIGHGLDISATGLITTIVLPSVIGLVLWVRHYESRSRACPSTGVDLVSQLIFAIMRPRFRQLYAVREWFVQPE